MGRIYSEPVVKTLFAHSGNRCYGDECKTMLTDRTMTRRVLGEIAHICAASPRGPRYDPSMSESERHDFSNLMLLCPNCHVLIDEIDPDSYPVDRLREMKARHENANRGSDWANATELSRVAGLAIKTAIAVAATRETFEAEGTVAQVSDGDNATATDAESTETIEAAPAQWAIDVQNDPIAEPQPPISRERENRRDAGISPEFRSDYGSGPKGPPPSKQPVPRPHGPNS